jgi:hypothetical protein
MFIVAELVEKHTTLCEHTMFVIVFMRPPPVPVLNYIHVIHIIFSKSYFVTLPSTSRFSGGQFS